MLYQFLSGSCHAWLTCKKFHNANIHVQCAHTSEKWGQINVDCQKSGTDVVSSQPRKLTYVFCILFAKVIQSWGTKVIFCAQNILKSHYFFWTQVWFMPALAFPSYRVLRLAWCGVVFKDKGIPSLPSDPSESFLCFWFAMKSFFLLTSIGWLYLQFMQYPLSFLFVLKKKWSKADGLGPFCLWCCFCFIHILWERGQICAVFSF